VYFYKLDDGQYIKTSRNLDHSPDYAGRVTRVSTVAYNEATRQKVRLDLSFVSKPGFIKRIDESLGAIDYTLKGDTLVVEDSTPEELQALFLEYNKCIKNSEIDARTRDLINQGFQFGGNQFSLSDTAQRNWMAIRSAVEVGDLDLPIKVSTIDDLEHEIRTPDELQSFFLTGIGTVKYHYGTGRDLKGVVDSKNDTSEVAAVEDVR
jgi:hypothetical protein